MGGLFSNYLKVSLKQMGIVLSVLHNKAVVLWVFGSARPFCFSFSVVQKAKLEFMRLLVVETFANLLES